MCGNRWYNYRAAVCDSAAANRILHAHSPLGVTRFLSCVAVVLLLVNGTCFAALAEQAEELGLRELEEAVEPQLGKVDITAGIDLDEGLSALFESGVEQMPGALRKAARSGAFLLVIVMLCGMADGIEDVSGSKGLSVVPLMGAIAVTAVAVADIHSLIGMGREAIGKMESLSKLLVPSLAAVTAAAGAPTRAAALQMATMLFSDILMTIINRLLLPLVYAYIAASAVNAALGNEGVKRLAELIKWAVTSILAALLLIFVGYLSVSGVIAGNTDAMAVKAAKFAVSGMVPVVGGILSDAAETVLAGAGILKGTVGVVGMLAILAICISPFLYLGIHNLTNKIAAALSAVLSDGRIAGLVSAIGGAFGLVLGMTGACALLLFISTISGISMVVK